MDKFSFSSYNASESSLVNEQNLSEFIKDCKTFKMFRGKNGKRGFAIFTQKNSSKQEIVCCSKDVTADLEDGSVVTSRLFILQFEGNHPFISYKGEAGDREVELF